MFSMGEIWKIITKYPTRKLLPNTQLNMFSMGEIWKIITKYQTRKLSPNTQLNMFSMGEIWKIITKYPTSLGFFEGLSFSSIFEGWVQKACKNAKNVYREDSYLYQPVHSSSLISLHCLHEEALESEHPEKTD